MNNQMPESSVPPAESARPYMLDSKVKRTPEQEARLKDYHSKVGQELVDNLNRKVLSEAAAPGTRGVAA